jgi:hypothetical protein
MTARDHQNGEPLSMDLAAEAIDIERILVPLGREWGVAELTASMIGAEGLGIVRDPDVIPGHVIVISTKTHRVRQHPAKNAVIVRLPTPVG